MTSGLPKIGGPESSAGVARVCLSIVPETILGQFLSQIAKDRFADDEAAGPPVANALRARIRR